jgi:hypothetical protein
VTLRLVAAVLALPGVWWARGPQTAGKLQSAPERAVLVSRHAERDFPLTADPASANWRDVTGVRAEMNYLGERIPGPPTEIRSRWTENYLYLLYTCPYDGLNLKPNPSTTTETPRLWNWDVAEAFLGSEPGHIGHYRELQVSPQSEWVDLDVDRDHPQNRLGGDWNSGYEVRGRIDAGRKIWYGEMRIPMKALEAFIPRRGAELRAGLYRISGRDPNKTFTAWRPTGQKTFHVPEAFGILKLE